MKRTFLTALLSLMMSVGALFAYDAQVGDLRYLLDNNSQTATVTYYMSSMTQGMWNGIISTTLTTANIPETIDVKINDTETKTYTVVAIDARAFENCKALETVTIPNTVQSIGESAFRDCIKLESVQMGNGVTSIDNYAFYNCNSLPHLTISNSVTSIGDYAFYNCTSLFSVNLPEALTSLGFYAFLHCSSLAYVTLPDSLKKIEDATFNGCTSLEYVYIPLSATEIGTWAFKDCPLKRVVWGARNCTAYDFGDQIESFEFCGPVEVIPNGLCKGKSFPDTYDYIYTRHRHRVRRHLGEYPEHGKSDRR